MWLLTPYAMKKIAIPLIAVVLLAGLTYSYGTDLQGAFPGPGASIKKADLSVYAIKVDEDGLLTVVLQNIGTKEVTSRSGVTSVYIDDFSSSAEDYVWSSLTDTNFLKAGGSSVLSVETLSEGTYAVYACVDTTAVVSESNESNNCNSVELVVGDYAAITDDHDPLEGVSVAGLSESDVSVDTGGETDGTRDVKDSEGSLLWSDAEDAPITAQCFLLPTKLATGAVNGFDYLSFWMKSSQTDTRLSDFGVYLGVDNACSVSEDDGEQYVSLVAPGATYDGASVASTQVVSETAGEWHLISVPLPLATDANNYVGIVLMSPTSFGKNDSVWFDDFSLYNE